LFLALCDWRRDAASVRHPAGRWQSPEQPRCCRSPSTTSGSVVQRHSQPSS